MNKIKIQFIFLCLVMVALAANIQAQKAGSSITSRTLLSKRGSQAIEQRVYDNGLGDIVQEIQSFPGSSLSSIVVLHEYDEQRRKTKTWLPVTTSSGSNFVTIDQIKSLANSRYSGDAAPFSRTEYDDFLQSQPSAQYKAGAKWQNNKKKVSVTYSEYEGVGMYETTPTTGGITTFKMKYLCTQTIDEDGVKSAEYTDMNGRLMITETSQGMTYYIYNNKGDIVQVVPPALSEYIISQYKAGKYKIRPTVSKISQYAYIYRYDNQRHCIYKKLPGCAPIYYVYDKAGNCILMQDGNMRKRDEWMYTIPDKFGRPCITGICKNDISYLTEPLHSKCVYAEYKETTATLGGYTVQGITLTSPKLYSATYYDNYKFIGKHGVPSSLNSSTSSVSTIDTSLGYGLQTGAATAILVASASQKEDSITGYTYSAMYYDSRYNISQVKTRNHLNGYETVNTKYSYTGKPLNVEIHRDRRKEGDNEKYSYSYDDADRLLTITHKVDDQTVRTIQQNSYNTLGQLSCLTHVTSGGNLTTSYSYDMHSWLTSISASYRSNLFQEKLMYADGTNPCYNGNISAMTWKAGYSDTQKKYEYVYDNASRLLSAKFSEGNNNQGQYNTSYTYDCMGNIISLVRNGKQDGGTYGKIDDLKMNYEGNRLISVTDKVSDPTYTNVWNFKDGANSSIEYSYDTNGNVIKDLNKGIESICYNSLNLPLQIQLKDGKSIKYTYSADGHKLRAEYITTKPVTRKYIDYCGNMILENGQLKQMNFDGGYLSFVGSFNVYHYYVKDHLGNNRMVVHENGTVEQTNHYYPYGGLMASSTNPGWGVTDVQNRFKYNGKELDRMHGLDWYDYGARWMDAVIGRWHSMDPLCEDYKDVSPYVYCHNNPVNAIDPDGKKSLLIIWCTSDQQIGHAAFAIENYKDHKGTGTYTVYGLFPYKPYGAQETDENKTVRGKFLISYNKTLEQIKEGAFYSGEEPAPDGILCIDSDESKDVEAKNTLKKEIKSNKGYNGRSRNCSTFAREGVRSASGDPNISGEESVYFNNVVTPNQLYYDTSKNENVSVKKDAGDKINYRAKQYVDKQIKEAK